MPSFAKDNPKEIKPLLGRTPTNRTPLDIHSKFHVEESFRDYIREHLGRALDPFAMRIERVAVHFEDINGSKRGVDTLCRIRVVLHHDEPVIIEELGEDAKVAFDVAVHRADRSTQRHIQRHYGRSPRAKPLV